jgi:mannose-6-phosphate isomerase class I
LRDALSEAQALLDGDEETLARVASSLLKPRRDNCVERPWGGSRIRKFKGLEENVSSTAPLGEAFEIAAFNDDDEARQYPSLLQFSDGSDVSLATAIERQADALLGSDFAARFGTCIPLLPKLLNVKELLSVQGHPEGNTEVYVIIDAEPGATIRVGFRDDIDPDELVERLIHGRQRQEALQSMLAGVHSADEIQRLVAPWFAERESGFEAIEQSFEESDVSRDELRECLVELKILYWHVLDAMNEIPVSPGQVIYNANPARITEETGKQASAEVHALGNPEKKEVLALEIRIREIDVRAAIAALNLQATTIDEYIVEPEPVAGRAGVFCSVDSAAFRVEHLRPSSTAPVEVPEEAPHFLFAIGGCARVIASDGRLLGDLRQGESAVVPIGIGSYRVESTTNETEIIKASLPVDA